MNFPIASITFGDRNISCSDIVRIARQPAVTAVVNTSPTYRGKLRGSTAYLDRLLEEDGEIYGVTTGYGDSVIRAVPPALVPELPLHLSRFHGCGLGEMLTPEQTRAVLAVRLSSLTHGFSGVSEELVDLLAGLLNHDILPRIPSEGSVGASGDLTPLSYVAAALIGERDVTYQGEVMPAAQALDKAGLHPITLRPKEALAIMNGTAVMTALTALAMERATYLGRLATRITSLAAIALIGNPAHFDARLFEAKPHPGQAEAAARIRADLVNLGADYEPARLQDRYSIRCAPHVIGVLFDMLPQFTQMVETEINSTNDNPLIDPDDHRILHGGHFYGGHMTFVADSLKNLVANLADLMDRQMALLVDTKFNHGLPSNLSGAEQARASINHGLKALQIGASAWTAEALKNTMPASVFSRSTECHNQDKVSMGTIASRDALRVCTLTEQVAAALLISVHQAVLLRLECGELRKDQLTPETRTFLDQLGETIPRIDEDHPLDAVLRQLTDDIHKRVWEI
ncbi:histidine ammonia-lyase [Ruegeria sp. ANG-R]|uniref:HAL/PAL/TAL family ammonia-lyase n=1 Tax=Ruegeria sp. ANG-R TaxID=1577903 RepID=UPI00057E8EE8|nr:aromatic amino acid ammonia-lyase [Ruegeria sp. ANG-R]KIC39801.1 histidine ammonia-lyase [Ruegeria sp. ANG-R]